MASSALPMPFSSTADMLSSVPADLFSGVTDTGDSGLEAAADGADDGTSDDNGENLIDTPEPIGDTATDEPAVEAEAEEPEEVEASAEEEKPAAKDETIEELPEGVRKGKDRHGKDGFFLEENRYKSIYGNHKLVQAGTELLGEPLTTEAIKLRNDAYLGNERMFNNLTSGDPSAQADVVNFILGEMTGAQENGEVGVDPTVPFAQTVYTALQKSAPEGYANLRLMAARDLVGEMYDEAAASNNTSLFSAAQHFAAAVANVGPKPANMTPEQWADHIRTKTAEVGIRFHTLPEMSGMVKAEDPLAAAHKRIAELESRQNGKTSAGTAEQFAAWSNTNIQSVNKAVFDDAVKPALASAEAAWKNFPNDYNDLVVDRLNRLVTKDVKADSVLSERVAELTARAKRATSEEVRNQIGTQIRQLFVHRANLAAEKHKPAVLKFAAESLKGRSDATHERRSGAQARTTPKGPSAPVKQSLVPPTVGFKNNVYDSATAMKQMAQLFR